MSSRSINHLDTDSPIPIGFAFSTSPQQKMKNAEQKRQKDRSLPFIRALEKHNSNAVPRQVLWDFFCEHPQYYHDCGIFHFFKKKHFEEINTFFEKYTSFLSKRAENDIHGAFIALKALYENSVQKVEYSGSFNTPSRLNLQDQTGQDLDNFIQNVETYENDMRKVFRDLHGTKLRNLLNKILKEGVLDACFKDVSNDFYKTVWEKVCDWANTKEKRSDIALGILSVLES